MMIAVSRRGGFTNCLIQAPTPFLSVLLGWLVEFRRFLHPNYLGGFADSREIAKIKFERIDDLTIFIIIKYHKINYFELMKGIIDI